MSANRQPSQALAQPLAHRAQQPQRLRLWEDATAAVGHPDEVAARVAQAVVDGSERALLCPTNRQAERAEHPCSRQQKLRMSMSAVD